MSNNSVTETPRPSPWPAVLLATLLTFPFLNKPFHIDDPVYVWIAQQISRDPLNFYGFEVNWHGTPQPVAQFNQNPPLYSYSLAIPGIIFGFSEPVMHLVNWGWLLLLLLGVHRLAARFCRNPGWVTLLAAVLPVVAVSATSVMCDIAMLALYTWSVNLWLAGLERGKWSIIATAAMLAAAAGLTKYFAVSLLPLLLARTLLIRKDRWALPFLALPLVVWGGYELLTQRLYFVGAVSQAAEYVVNERLDPTSSLLSGFCFLGGLCLPAGFAMFIALGWKSQLCALLAVGLAALAYYGLGTFAVDGLLPSEELLCGVAGVFVVSGVLLLGEAALRGCIRPAPDIALLSLWLCGTFVFSVCVNWTVNARGLLPAAVPIAILTVMRLESLKATGFIRARLCYGAAVVAGVVLSLMVSWGDAKLAWSARELADKVRQDLSGRPAMARVWFEGHWGFQFYMQSHGFQPLDLDHPAAGIGDFIVLPENNTNVVGMPEGMNSQLHGVMKVRNNSRVAVFDTRYSAGYYTAQAGDLPYMWGGPAMMHAIVVEVTGVSSP